MEGMAVPYLPFAPEIGSGWIKSTLDSSGNNLNTTINNVSGWSLSTLNSSGTNISGWAGTTINNVSGWVASFPNANSVSGWTQSTISNSGANISGWASTSINNVSGWVASFPNAASVSGWASSTITNSGNAYLASLNASGTNISGWTNATINSSGNSISGWANSALNSVSGWASGYSAPYKVINFEKSVDYVGAISDTRFSIFSSNINAKQIIGISGLRTVSGTCCVSLFLNSSGISGLYNLNASGTKSNYLASVNNNIATGDEVSIAVSGGSASPTPYELKFSISFKYI